MIFRSIGLFDSDNEWIHPERTEPTYELIYNLEGDIYIEEAGTAYTLSKGSLIILRPGVMHKGFQKSYGRTAFYWVHFSLEEGDFPFPCHSETFTEAHLLRELMHVSHAPHCPAHLKNAVLTHILSRLSFDASLSDVPKLVAEVYAYARAHASAKLSVSALSRHFQYSDAHLSRLMKKSYGLTLKGLLTSLLLSRAKELLTNTSFSVKECSARLEFPDDKAFIHFFRYHEGTSPSAYRKSYTHTYINAR